jgi:uncharacterized membrane protein
LTDPNLLYYGGYPDVLRLLLVGAGFLLPLRAALLPRSPIGRYGVVLLVLAAVAIGLWLSLYAFGEDDYTNNGESRWQTHNSTGSHLFYVVAVSFVLLLAVVAASLRQRQTLVRVVAMWMAFASALLWFGSALAFDNN